MTLKLEIGKQYKTRGGKCIPLRHNKNGKTLCWHDTTCGYDILNHETSTGICISHKSMNIIEEWKEPKTGIDYVVFLKCGGKFFWGEPFPVDTEGVLACKRVEWTEGDTA